MDYTKIAMQLLSFLGKNPQLIQQFIQHPYSTTTQATGATSNLSATDMSQVVTAAAALSNNQQLGGSDLSNVASALLGQNNGSIHSLTSMLFGGGNTAQATSAAQAQTTQAGTLDLGSLVNMASLASTLMGASKPTQAAKPSVDLSDGLDIGEIATLASQFLGGSSTATAAAAKPTQTQQASSGIDFGTIAQLASVFLKNQ